MKEQGRRYNTGKLRYDLLPTGPIKDIVKVYTNGAHKYTIYEDEENNQILGKNISLEDVVKRGLKMVEDGANNWRKGMSWKETAACAQRHIVAFLEGEDIDPDPIMQTKHLANAAWNLLALLEFYKTHPEMDDREQHYLNPLKIGLDIDNVICDWTKGWGEKYNLNTRPMAWSFCYKNKERLQDSNKELKEIYKNLPVLTRPEDIPFEPHCYLTARSIDPEITKEWLQSNGFPTRPVYTVPFGASKVEMAKQSGIDIFVDDSYTNFVELNNAGICCYLFDQPHNQKYNVGYKRIHSLKELV